jgi:Rrf2 family protein
MMPASSRFAVAVHILALMAQGEEEPVKSEILASSVNTNPVVIRRIMCALADAKLVTSHTGANGGSKLAQKSGQITLLDVYHAIEGRSVFELHRHPPSRHCMVGSNIKTVLGSVLEEVNLEVERVLAKTTIEQVLQIIQARARGRKRN